MNKRLLPVLFLFFWLPDIAQNTKEYPVRVGEIPNEVLPREAMYVLTVFKEGTIFLKDGTTSVKKLNYNFLMDEMHFIGAANDTLAIAEPALIKSVVIDSMVFYFDGGFYREIFNTGKYKLGVKQVMLQVMDKTRGGYDVASGSSAIKTYGTLNYSSQVYKLVVKKDVLFRQEVSYYISDAFAPFLKATKKHFHLLFEEKDISRFVKEHHTNFNMAEDLKALLKFCVE